MHITHFRVCELAHRQVVELPQYDTDADAVRINLAPILAMVHLLRKVRYEQATLNVVRVKARTT